MTQVGRCSVNGFANETERVRGDTTENETGPPGFVLVSETGGQP